MKSPRFIDPVLGPLTDDALTSTYRVWQRLGGHRFSSDDTATAFLAWTACPSPARVLDLGTGLGSVMLTLAAKMPTAVFVGVEAQDLSFGLLERNVLRNGLSDRVTIHQGDLRDPAVHTKLGGPFDLITGTPPYFPPDTATDAMDPQRAYARIEYRGGVEAYLTAAAQLLGRSGVFVLCGDSRADGRVTSCGAALGLSLRARCPIIPFEGRPPLFSVWTFSWPSGPEVEPAFSTLTLRDAQGRQTPDANTLRTFSGFPPRPPAPTPGPEPERG